MQMININRIASIILIMCLAQLPVNTYAESPTDEELKALEQQIEQQEQEQIEARKQAEAETRHKAEAVRQQAEREAELRKIEEQQRTAAEAARQVEIEQKRKEQEIIDSEKEKQNIYSKHLQSAGSYMDEDKFDMAIQEYQKILEVFPEDTTALDGISKASKYLNACNEIVGTWYVEPNGINWEVHQDNTIFGTWLVFSSNGFWECLSPREREFVTSWPNCAVCNTDYFILSEDGNTLQGTRHSKNLNGRRVSDPID